MTASGKIALISGASRGIGKAIAMAIGQQGATVIGTATTQQGAEAITQYLHDNNIQGTGMVLDVSQLESIEIVVNAINEQFGAPQILVNNAAITRDNLMMRMKEEEWHDIIETNLTSIFRLTKACIRGMVKARWGRVVSISSVTGFAGNPGQVNYGAAKAGIVGFSKCLAHELGSRNITVNVVAPGFIETDMTKDLAEDHAKRLRDMIPANRLGQPEEIAAAVAFLTSESASYITGETIHVNGGMYMD